MNGSSGGEKPAILLHHLPTREQNIFYTLFLIVSPLSNLIVNALTFEDFRLISLQGSHRFSFLHGFFELSGVMLGVVLFLLGVNLVLALMRHQRRIRHSLLLFGIFSSLYLFLNLISITYGIFVFKIQSLFLLGISSGIYISINTVFLFWYWYVDYPTQVRHLHHPESSLQIAFPFNSGDRNGNWVPSFIDYLYLTIMTSNTLGPPENHQALGNKAKIIQLLHSVIMLILLVIFVSRAINTLA